MTKENDATVATGQPVIMPGSQYLWVDTAIKKWVKANLGEHPVYPEKAQRELDNGFGSRYFRAGGIVTNSEGRILMMLEAKVQVKKIRSMTLKNYYLVEGKEPGDWVNEEGGWNLPSGRQKPKETFEEAVQREVYEESGWKVKIVDCLDIRYGDKKDNLYAMPIYLMEGISGPKEYRTGETKRIAWLSAEQIRGLIVIGALRSPEFVEQALNAYEKMLDSN